MPTLTSISMTELRQQQLPSDGISNMGLGTNGPLVIIFGHSVADPKSTLV